MPTRGRREFAQKAVQSFLAQTYSDKELVILDDGDDPSFPDGISDSLIQYERLQNRLNIPRKRNACCEMAKGAFICHFDSDDYSAPTRIANQLEYLKNSTYDMAGFRELYLWDCESEQAYKYRSPRTYHIVGTSLMYRRVYWHNYPFRVDRDVCSDNEFISHGTKAQASGLGLIVARIHGESTQANVKDSIYNYLRSNRPNVVLSPVSQEELPQGFFA